MTAPDSSPLIYVDLYEQPAVTQPTHPRRLQRGLHQSRRRPGRHQAHRARGAQDCPGATLAVASHQRQDELFGSQSDVYLRQAEQGDLLLRLASEVD